MIFCAKRVLRSLQQLCVTPTPGTGKLVLGVYFFLRDVLEAVQPDNVAEHQLAVHQHGIEDVLRYYHSSGAVYLSVDYAMVR